MRHTREEVIRCTIDEYNRLDRLVSGLTEYEWYIPEQGSGEKKMVNNLPARIAQ